MPEGTVTIGEHGLPPGTTLEDAGRGLRNFFAQKLNDPGLETTEFRKLAGGASNHTFLYEAKWQEGGQPRTGSFIVRWDPEFGLVEPYDMAYQYRIMSALQDSPVPVPRTLWLEEDPSVIGRAFYVVGRVDAEIGERAIHHREPDRRRKQRRSHVETMAAIHAVDWKARGLDRFMRVPGPGKDYALHEVDRWEDVIHRKQAEPDPVLEASAKWMRDNAFETSEVCLLHGDCSGTNYMIADDRIAAVIDWEMSTLGDPMVEIGWYLGCINTLGPSITGLTPEEVVEARREFVDTYLEITGRTYDGQKVLWGEIMYNYQLMSVGVSGQWMARQQGLEPMRSMDNQFRAELKRLVGVEG